MGILQVKGINLSFGDRRILINAGFTLGEHARAALCGGNGEGKSTLLKIVAGWTQAETGEVVKSRGMRVSYLPQSDIVMGELTVYEEIEKAFTEYNDALTKQAETEAALAENPDDKRLLSALDEIHSVLYGTQAFEHKSKIHSIAEGLGFSENDMERKCSEFSGGYQMRIALARLLCEEPDAMLLDEPTNYLDIESRLWLANYLKNYPGSVMLVCHDREFLDNVVTEVYELFAGRLTRYSGNYSYYEARRALELEQLEAAYRKQQAEIDRTEAFIEKFRYKATKARQVQSRIKMLEKIEPVIVPGHLKTLRFTFPEPPHSPNDMVRIENLTKVYNATPLQTGRDEKAGSVNQEARDKAGSDTAPHPIQVFSGLNLNISRGQRLAVTGHNGIGKSTLLRIIAGMDRDYSGSVTLGSGVRIGYYEQDASSSLTPGNTVLDEVLPYGPEGEMRNALGSFLFSGDDIYKSIQVLSGGEKSRLQLLKVLLCPANLLILDEPTNHLDINAKDMLSRALKDYSGTVIFVSHDSYFIKGIADTILYLSENGPELFHGDWEYFSWRLAQRVLGKNNENTAPDKRGYKRDSLVQGDLGTEKTVGKDSIPPRSVNPAAPDDAKSRKELSRELRAEANRQKNRLSRLRKEAAELLEKTSTLEAEIVAEKEKLNQSEYYSDAAKANGVLSEINRLETEKNAAEEAWIAITEEIEALET